MIGRTPLRLQDSRESRRLSEWTVAVGFREVEL